MGGAMGLIQMLADEVDVRVVIRGASCLLPFEGMNAVLEACRKKGIKVLGIEGFWPKGDALVPEMDAIADFSDQESSLDSITDAIRFIRVAGKTGMLFDLIINGTGSSLEP